MNSDKIFDIIKMKILDVEHFSTKEVNYDKFV